MNFTYFEVVTSTSGELLNFGWFKLQTTVNINDKKIFGNIVSYLLPSLAKETKDGRMKQEKAIVLVL